MAVASIASVSTEPRLETGGAWSLAGGAVVWMTGLPSSGKSTLAGHLHGRLAKRGCASCVLDGDSVRATLVPRPGYTPSERDAFYATLAGLAALLAGQRLITIVPATAHRAAYLEGARRRVPRFVEVHVAATLEDCRRRDTKGLYAAVAAGAVIALPGADLPYEEPLAPDVVATGGEDRTAVERILALLDGASSRTERS